jgi:hypothetical protein
MDASPIKVVWQFVGRQVFPGNHNAPDLDASAGLNRCLVRPDDNHRYSHPVCHFLAYMAQREFTANAQIERLGMRNIILRRQAMESPRAFVLD